MASSSSAVAIFFSSAFERSRAGSMPPPSSEISSAIWFPRWYAEILSVPSGSLPAAVQCVSGVSMP